MPLRRTALVGLAGLALTLAACSSASDEPDPTSVPSAAPTTIQMDPALLDEIQAGLERREQTFRDVLACMEESGWPVAVSGTEQFTVVGDTEEQTPLVREAYRTCSESTGWSGPTDVDPRALAKLYSYELATRDCLIELGLPVDTPPSEEAFIERFTTSDRWSAYSGAELGERGDVPSWDEINRVCPQPIRYVDLG